VEQLGQLLPQIPRLRDEWGKHEHADADQRGYDDQVDGENREPSRNAVAGQGILAPLDGGHQRGKPDRDERRYVDDQEHPARQIGGPQQHDGQRQTGQRVPDERARILALRGHECCRYLPVNAATSS
jgi:hypothetical protein